MTGGTENPSADPIDQFLYVRTKSTAGLVIETTEDGTTIDAGDLGTAWLPYTHPTPEDILALADALTDYAKDL